MHCPFCGHEETNVKDSRPAEEGAVIRRRRECPVCERRFTTFERVQLREAMVIKSNGRRELYNEGKLIRSLKLSLQKRPVTPEKIEEIARLITRQIESSGEAEVTTGQIGEMVLDILADLDRVGWVRYASVHLDFELDDFLKHLGPLKRRGRRAAVNESGAEGASGPDIKVDS